MTRIAQGIGAVAVLGMMAMLMFGGWRGIETFAFATPQAKFADVWLPAHGASRAPLIVYVPGWGAARHDNRALLRGLTAMGYAVVAIDDIAHDRALANAADEAARTAVYDLSSDEAAARFVAAADRRVVLQARQVSALLDALAADAALSARIDMGRAGIVGYSFGGATAARLGRAEPRLKAIVNLDGWQFGPGADDLIAKPVLAINSVESGFTPQTLVSPDAGVRNAARLNAKEQAWQMRQVVARTDATRLLLAGASHPDLSDGIASWRRWMRSWSREDGLVTADTARVALDDVIASFLDRYVREQPGRELAHVIAAHPVMIDLGRDQLPCQRPADRCALPPKG